MADIKYTKEHEWIRVEGDVATVGITEYAQEQLGDVVFVDCPQAGRKVAKGEACAVVESVKAASDIYAPGRRRGGRGQRRAGRRAGRRQRRRRGQGLVLQDQARRTRASSTG